MKKFSGKRMLTILPGAVLVIFLSVLLLINYKSQVRLRQSSLDNLVRKVEQQALEISHLFSQSRLDLKALADARELHLFFANKALGMSMDYGLKASLTQIKKKFDAMTGMRVTYGNPVYNRIFFQDNTGTVLVDSRHSADENVRCLPKEKKLSNSSDQVKFSSFYDDGILNLVAVVPYFFKGTETGQIFVCLNPDSFLPEVRTLKNKSAALYTGIDFRVKDDFAVYPEPGSAIPESVFRSEPGKIIHYILSGSAAEKIECLAVRISIPDTDFFLVASMPVSDAGGLANPSHLLLALFILAVFVVSGSMLLWKMHTRELLLEIRLAQENIRKIEIEEKNIALETEIMVSKSLEQSLRESEEKFKTMSVAAQDAVIMIDNNGLISFWNRAAGAIFGYSSHEAINRDFHLVMAPDQYHALYQEKFTVFRETGKGDAVGKTLELSAKKKNGEIFPVELSLSAIKIEGKWNALGILRDISQRKKTEAELQDYRQNLERLVKERTRDLEQAQKELINKAVDAGRAQLSAMVLHNIGNAVTPVAVETERLKKSNCNNIGRYLRKCYDELADHKGDLTDYVTRDKRGIQVVRYMNNLIEEVQTHHLRFEKAVQSIYAGVDYIAQILSLQRAYAPGKTEMKERTNLNDLVKDALKIQESAVTKRKIDVTLDLSSSLPIVSIEKNKMMQVLINFIKNSCDAIDENQEEKHHQINVSTFPEKDKTVIRITDTGCGIEPDRIEEIFEFGTSSKGSSGFGLYYCKSFIEAGNGTLTLESGGKNKGATVTVKLPANSVHGKGLKK